MKMIITVFLMAAAINLHGSDPAAQRFAAANRWAALALVEGGSDSQRGPCGEVSRYGIMPANWLANAMAGESPTNQWQALALAMRIQSRRVAAFARAHSRMPTDGEWVVRWHCLAPGGRN